MNEYFASVFTVENLQNFPVAEQVFKGNADKALTSIGISETVVLEKLNKLNVNKSHGPDELHGKFLYELRHELFKPLTKLFKDSLKSGILPQDWRDANVIPLHKKGRKDLAQNYRPVSLTSVVGKLLEQIVKDYLVAHLDKFNLI